MRIGALILAAVAAAAQAQGTFITAAEVRPIVAGLGERVPADVRRASADDAAWSAWVAAHDRGIRQRLAQGDEDTLLNWLLLGTSFTQQPTVTLDANAADDQLRALAARIAGRIEDLVRGATRPDGDARKLFARDVLRERGFDLADPGAADGARDFLIRRLGTFILEWSRRDQTPGAFADRGLSLDTSLQPNFAVDAALTRMKETGVLTAGRVRRIAIVGAGLDFADKNSGFDFYPPQTVQPFAVLESLRRLALIPSLGEVELVALDVSPRVVSHIEAARMAAGRGYVINLPLDGGRPWAPAFREYWQTFGARIGVPVTAQPLVPRVDLRAVRVDSSVAQRISAVDFNVVTGRWSGQPFDLVVATNVLLYYDPFEQAMAMENIRRMLRPGGVFATNTAVTAVGASFPRSGSLAVGYTADGAGDVIDWFRRE